jgi:hypothetical protein
MDAIAIEQDTPGEFTRGLSVLPKQVLEFFLVITHAP